MKRSFKILIFLMAFAFMGVMNVKAASGICTGGGSCDQKDTEAYCNAASSSGCSWKWTSCDPGYGLLNDNCIKCTGQLYSPGGSGLCRTCNEGYHVNDDNSDCIQDKVTPSMSASASPKTVTSPGTSRISYSVTYNGSALSGEGSVSYSITAGSQYGTISGNTVTCNSKANGIITVLVRFTANSGSRYNSTSASTTVTCSYVAETLDHLTGSGEIWVNQGETDTVNVSAKDNDDPAKPVNVDSWTSSDTSVVTIPAECAGNHTCVVKVKGWACNGTKTVTITAKKGNETATHTLKVYTYGPWVEKGQQKAPTGHTTRDGMAHREGCDAYENVDPATGIGTRWNRCCGGGTPDTPACYKCGEELKWGKYASDTSCTFISENQSDCEEAPLCYKNVNTGEYDWGKHSGDNAWVKISDKEEDCQKETEEEDPACYTKDNKYYWGKYKGVEGYTFTSLTEAQCKEFCYKEKATGDYVWGNHVGDDKYEVVASITDKNKCKAACYKCGEDLKWGPYADDNNCKEVPGVTTLADCDVTPPPTGVSVSNILYACGAFLVIMGSGIVVYQLTKVKKQLD